MTPKQLTKLINSRLEDEETPARVMAWAEANQGKPIRSNNVPDGFRVVRQYGMTDLQTLDYARSHGHKGAAYLVAHRETGATVPTPATLRDLACPHYRGIEERNAWRRKMLANPAELETIAKAISRTQRAVNKYRKAQEALEALTDHPRPDWIILRDAAGVIKEARK